MFLKKLFNPIKINSLELPNRVLMNGLHLGLEKDPNSWGAMARFYARRARGDIGLMITGGCSPNEVGKVSKDGFALCNDDEIALHKRITDAVHAEGGRIALQLLHFGRESFHGYLVSASNIRAHNNIFKPRALTHEEILQTIVDYGDATRRAREAGYDAVEILGSQGFLLHQFLSKHINTRKDEWNGDLLQRFRLTREVLDECRRQGGADFPLLFRFPALDLLPVFNDREDAKILLGSVKEAKIDLINIGIGTHESKIQSTSMIVPRAGFASVAKFLKENCGDTPISVSNRINDARLAEELLQAGVGDMVSMGRAFLADPDMLIKAKNAQFNNINTCIACNQACLDRALFGIPTACTVNPICSTEYEMSGLPKATQIKKYAVIGGGIAGMAAATNLAELGHSVDLFEKEDELGGQMRFAAKIDGKQEFLETIRYYTHRMHALHVNIKLGYEVSAEQLRAGQYDNILIATGTIPKTAQIEHDDSVPIMTYEDVLKFDAPVTYPALIIGSGGVAVDVACHLKTRSWWQGQSTGYLRQHITDSELQQMQQADNSAQEVILLQRSAGGLARKVGATTRKSILGKMEALGVHVRKSAKLKHVAAHCATIEYDDGKQEVVHVGSIIVAIGQDPNLQFANSMAQAGIDFAAIGGVNEKLNDAINITTSIQDAFNASLTSLQ